MTNWYVAYTQASKEVVAYQNLIEQGFDAYLPRFKKIRRHARRVDEVLTPLFPRYIFVGMNLDNEQWRSVNGTRGVSHVLCTGENSPTRIPARIINAFKSQEISDGIVPVTSLSVFEEGDKVRVLEGAFKDQVAVFEKLDDANRVRLLLNFLGREMNVSLPVYAVEAV